MLGQFASIIGEKASGSNKLTNDLLLNLSEQFNILSNGKTVDRNYSFKAADLDASIAQTSAQELLYGTLPNYFAGQTLPQQMVQRNTTKSGRPVQATNQTGALVVILVTPVPITSILSSPLTPLCHTACHLFLWKDRVSIMGRFRMMYLMSC